MLLLVNRIYAHECLSISFASYDCCTHSVSGHCVNCGWRNGECTGTMREEALTEHIIHFGNIWIVHEGDGDDWNGTAVRQSGNCRCRRKSREREKKMKRPLADTNTRRDKSKLNVKCFPQSNEDSSLIYLLKMNTTTTASHRIRLPRRIAIILLPF